ncbi:hypothetical protein [Streptomyces sp. ISL-11]|uniref:hypothetical protein n=1 Tax=Streptomyces sp. ISL-11 TaxID=2819174 RepID=UPI001BE9E0B0|nr:hypothetical protein [Streptomyces sp. ISL-11]MBT2386694.1 hypothetical protein [Streptomyces sp. ISL-11]
MGSTDVSCPLGRDGGRADMDLPGKGSGPRHAELPVRPYDLLLRAACRTLPPLCSALRLPQAAGTLRHYLRGTGTPYRVDAAELLALPAVRSAAEEQLDRWRAEALARWRPGPRTPAAYPADSGWRGVPLARRGSRDWWLALRGIDYRLTGTVRVDADGGTAADYRFAVQRNWTPFAAFARLHETGLAREFTVTGEAFGHV